MRAVVLSFLLLSASVALSAPAPFARPDRRTDVERMQGEWVQETVYVWREGRWVELLSHLPFAVRIRGNRFDYGDHVEYFSLHGKCGIDIVSDPTRRPNQGVYSIAGSTLTLVLPQTCEEPRPPSIEVGDVKRVYHRK